MGLISRVSSRTYRSKIDKKKYNMPWSSLILSKLHSVESEQNQKNVSPVHSLDIRTSTDNKTIKLITSGNDKTIRIWEILANNITIENIQDLSSFMSENGGENPT